MVSHLCRHLIVRADCDNKYDVRTFSKKEVAKAINKCSKTHPFNDKLMQVGMEKLKFIALHLRERYKKYGAQKASTWNKWFLESQLFCG